MRRNKDHGRDLNQLYIGDRDFTGQDGGFLFRRVIAVPGRRYGMLADRKCGFVFAAGHLDGRAVYQHLRVGGNYRPGQRPLGRDQLYVEGQRFARQDRYFLFVCVEAVQQRFHRMLAGRKRGFELITSKLDHDAVYQQLRRRGLQRDGHADIGLGKFYIQRQRFARQDDHFPLVRVKPSLKRLHDVLAGDQLGLVFPAAQLRRCAVYRNLGVGGRNGNLYPSGGDGKRDLHRGFFLAADLYLFLERLPGRSMDLQQVFSRQDLDFNFAAIVPQGRAIQTDLGVLRLHFQPEVSLGGHKLYVPHQGFRRLDRNFLFVRLERFFKRLQRVLAGEQRCLIFIALQLHLYAVYIELRGRRDNARRQGAFGLLQHDIRLGVVPAGGRRRLEFLFSRLVFRLRKGQEMAADGDVQDAEPSVLAGHGPAAGPVQGDGDVGKGFAGFVFRRTGHRIRFFPENEPLYGFYLARSARETCGLGVIVVLGGGGFVSAFFHRVKREFPVAASTGGKRRGPGQRHRDVRGARAVLKPDSSRKLTFVGSKENGGNGQGLGRGKNHVLRTLGILLKRVLQLVVPAHHTVEDIAPVGAGPGHIFRLPVNGGLSPVRAGADAAYRLIAGEHFNHNIFQRKPVLVGHLAFDAAGAGVVPYLYHHRHRAFYRLVVIPGLHRGFDDIVAVLDLGRIPINREVIGLVAGLSYRDPVFRALPQHIMTVTVPDHQRPAVFVVKGDLLAHEHDRVFTKGEQARNYLPLAGRINLRGDGGDQQLGGVQNAGGGFARGNVHILRVLAYDEPLHLFHGAELAFQVFFRLELLCRVLY